MSASPADSCACRSPHHWIPLALVAAVILLQGMAWQGRWLEMPDSSNRHLFALVEMILIGLLVGNGWLIRRQVVARARQHPLGRRMNDIALLCFIALAVCSLGDAVNRNFPGVYFAYDPVIRHSYLADSVWFFFPGYLLFLVAVWRATREWVASLWREPLLMVAGAGGAVSFITLVLPETSLYVKAMTGPYTVLISLMVPAGVWCWLAFGRKGVGVALGAALATVADALIGNFWLYAEGYYPGIAHLNFVVYFISQTLLQRLPLVYAQQLEAQASQRG